MAPPRASVTPTSLPRPNIRYRNAGADGQATGVTATVTKSMLGTGTRADPRLTPPGWQGNGLTYNEARGHLLARQLGGRGDEPRNLVTLTQNAANSPHMSGFERQVARRVRDGEVVEYSATPLYSRGILPPAAMLLTAQGSRGAPAARIIQNPAGRGK
ncbi:DNA/RNA non-specific endonuclease [Phenylobacterium sp.]|uniref:DNA/RNA non-specific endonuclease n=1 Tax=Phenylobacterium sp. TaxID=1871053 RepID=UPI00391DCD9C